MALVRLREPHSVRTVLVDGSPIKAGVGEPLAMAIGASGRLLLSRSVKYHRPRGAACYSNRCDGCLMRVDGQQSVPTCNLRVEREHVCTTQNVLGSAHTDLLSVTDWFFRDGLDHHHMFTRFGPVNRMMQKVARRIAGVGTLPDRVSPVVDAAKRSLDVVIVGAGASGLRLATKLGELGRDVVVLDERTRLPTGAEKLRKSAERVNARIELGVCALGVYERSVLVFDGARCEVLEPRQLVFATGTHDHVPAVRGADHPGVITGQAAHRLLDEGFSPGKQVLLVCQEEGGAAPLQRRLERAGVSSMTQTVDDVARLRGGNCVQTVELSSGESRSVDAVVFDGFRTGVYELPVQAGGNAQYHDDGFWVDVDAQAHVASNTFAVGSCVDGYRKREGTEHDHWLEFVAQMMNKSSDVR